MVGIDRRLLQNVDWPLLGATVCLVALSATTLATLSVGRAGTGVALRQIAWFGLGLIALLVVGMDHSHILSSQGHSFRHL